MQRDDAIAETVISDDDPIDELYLKIDSQHPLRAGAAVPRGGRFFGWSPPIKMHSNLHLERVGDQAVNVAKLYLRTKDTPGSAAMRQQLEEMGTLVVGMIRTAMEAFGRRESGIGDEGAVDGLHPLAA